MVTTKKNDFIELQFTGYHDGKVFDSNITEDLKKLNPDAKPELTIVVIGESMIVPGLDKALEGKQLNKQYEIHIPYKDGFGPRRPELVKTIPLKIFTEHKLDPKPGSTFVMDNSIARVITVSGARVITDFNNPLSGKNLDYKFKITKIITEEKDKAEALFKFYFKIVPKFTIKEEKIEIQGPAPMEALINAYKDKFKTLLKKELIFKPELPKDKKENNNP